jgi:glutathione S-transferase
MEPKEQDMNDEIQFYTAPMSRGRMVHWMLEEVGAAYRPHLFDLSAGEHKNAEFLAINPLGKVPAIVHRGAIITEVGAIIAYLADAFPDARLAPPIADPRRGPYLRWMFFAAATLEPAIVDHVTERPPPTTRTLAISYGSVHAVTDTLADALRRSPYLLGDAFSAADLYVGSSIAFGIGAKCLSPLPEFQDYLARVTKRPANERFEAQAARWMADMEVRKSKA